MKNYIVNIINKMETFRNTRPRLFKLCLISLCCFAPIEMLCIYLGMFGYKKLKSYSNKTIEEMK